MEGSKSYFFSPLRTYQSKPGVHLVLETWFKNYKNQYKGYYTLNKNLIWQSYFEIDGIFSSLVSFKSDLVIGKRAFMISAS